MRYNRYVFLTLLMEGAKNVVHGSELILAEPLYDLAHKHRTHGVVHESQTETQRQAAVLRHFLASHTFSKDETGFLHPLLAELEL